MNLYLMNSPVLTAYGTFELSGPLSVETVRAKLSGGFNCAIGHQATATFLSARLGLRVDTARIQVTTIPGDQAIILRLLERLPENLVLDAAALATFPHEFALLEHLK